MKLLRFLTLALSLFATLLALVACGSGATAPTPLAPAGTAGDLNTFIFVYTDT